MFRVKVMHQPDRSRQEAIKARIKERRKAEHAQTDADNYSVKQTFVQEKNNVDS
jgi:hypothetical protein